MEARDAQTGVTRRQQALDQLAAAAAAYGSPTRCVLFENVLRTPQEVAAARPPSPPPQPRPHGYRRRSPRPLRRRRHIGSPTTAPRLAEIWIASDLQRSNWQPASPRWRTISTRVAALPETVRVRLLALSGRTAPNASVTLVSAIRADPRREPSLNLTFDIQRSDPTPATLPLSISLDGVRTHLDLPVDGPVTRVHHSLPLDPARDSGYGSIQLPPDGNDRDNTAWFVYSPPPPSTSPSSVPTTPAAAASSPPPTPSPTTPSSPATPSTTPAGHRLGQIRPRHLDRSPPLRRHRPGPSALRPIRRRPHLLPLSPVPQTPTPSTASWSALLAASPAQPFRVIRWDTHDGPLADSESGTPLALPALRILRAEPIAPGGDIRAALRR